MRPPSPFTARQAGGAIVGILVLAMVLGLALMGLQQSLVLNRKKTLQAQDLQDVSMIRDNITRAIDCDRTLKGIDLATQCDDTLGLQDGPYFPLRASDGSAVVGTVATVPGSPHPMVYHQVGSWRVRASCSKALGTLIVRYAKIDATGTQMTSRLSHIDYAWTDSPKSLMFGDAASVLCGEVFGASSSGNDCGDDQYVVGFNRKTKTPICANFPSGDCGIANTRPLTRSQGILLNGATPYVACTWQTQGGQYEWHSGEGCRRVNFWTGACTCPAGYSPHEWAKIETKCSTVGYPGVNDPDQRHFIKNYTCAYFNKGSPAAQWVNNNDIIRSSVYHCIKD